MVSIKSVELSAPNQLYGPLIQSWQNHSFCLCLPIAIQWFKVSDVEAIQLPLNWNEKQMWMKSIVVERTWLLLQFDSYGQYHSRIYTKSFSISKIWNLGKSEKFFFCFPLITVFPTHNTLSMYARVGRLKWADEREFCRLVSRNTLKYAFVRDGLIM